MRTKLLVSTVVLGIGTAAPAVLVAVLVVQPRSDPDPVRLASQISPAVRANREAVIAAHLERDTFKWVMESGDGACAVEELGEDPARSDGTVRVYGWALCEAIGPGAGGSSGPVGVDLPRKGWPVTVIGDEIGKAHLKKVPEPLHDAIGDQDVDMAELKRKVEARR